MKVSLALFVSASALWVDAVSNNIDEELGVKDMIVLFMVEMSEEIIDLANDHPLLGYNMKKHLKFSPENLEEKKT